MQCITLRNPETLGPVPPGATRLGHESNGVTACGLPEKPRYSSVNFSQARHRIQTSYVPPPCAPGSVLCTLSGEIRYLPGVMWFARTRARPRSNGMAQ